MDDGFVYFVKAGSEFVKIGFSKNPDTRINGIRSSNPLFIKLLGVIRGNYQTERKIQEMFSHHRVRGEWFNFCEEIESYINENASTYNLKTPATISMMSENILYLKWLSKKSNMSISFIINNLIDQRRLYSNEADY